jgi:hypothetical protein
MMINFKQYYRQAIVRNKTNLDEMIRSVWAIWKHKVCETKEDFLKKETFYYSLRRTKSHIMSGVQ